MSPHLDIPAPGDLLVGARSGKTTLLRLLTEDQSRSGTIATGARRHHSSTGESAEAGG